MTGWGRLERSWADLQQRAGSTLLNAATNISCAACGDPRRLAPDEWACERCTFRNPATASACGMCAPPRAQPPAQQPQPLGQRLGGAVGQKTKQPAGKESKPKKGRADDAARTMPLECYFAASNKENDPNA